jgi:hypothetical protein
MIGDPGDDDGKPEMDCTDASMLVRFDEDKPPFFAIHHAAGLIPGEYGTTASWTGEGGAIAVTMTLAHQGDSYEVSVADLGLYCSVSVEVPVALILETGDGQLAVDSLSTWVQAPGADASEDIYLAAVLSADPHDTDWLTLSVFEMWPEIASPDDDAMLWLELESGEESIQGRLDYEKRELVDANTVFYYRDTLLEWNAPRMR